MGDNFLSDANLPHRETIRRPSQHDIGEVPVFDNLFTGVKCWCVPEGMRSAETGFGYVVTGRYSILFKHGLVVEPKWWVDVTDAGVPIGTYVIDQVISAKTHVEVIGVRQN